MSEKTETEIIDAVLVKYFTSGFVAAVVFIALGWLILGIGCTVGELKKIDSEQSSSIEHLKNQNGMSKEYWDNVSVKAKLSERTAIEALKAANEAHKRINRIEDFLEDEEEEAKQ